MIQTVDFFTPVVDDAYYFGQIAAANALSDVYAMGGEPKLALNIAAFPSCLSPDILGEILRGGADKVREAGAVLAGGHTIQDEEPKYGLCVTGFVHPEKLWKNAGALEGDVLILTKPLGCGIMSTAIKAGLASGEEELDNIRVMAELNKYARDAVEGLRIHACTDVTGFGLIGHALEMAQASEKTLVLHGNKLPVIAAAKEYAAMGLVPAGSYRNREFAADGCEISNVEMVMEDLLFDPQTSGGLLLAIHPGDVDRAMERLSGLRFPGKVIGEVLEKQEKSLLVCP